MAERTQAIERYLSILASRMRLHEAQHILIVIMVKRITTFAPQRAVGNVSALSVYRQCKRITTTVVSLVFLLAIARGRTLHVLG